MGSHDCRSGNQGQRKPAGSGSGRLVQVTVFQDLDYLFGANALEADVITTMAVFVGVDIEAGTARLGTVEDCVGPIARRAVDFGTFRPEEGSHWQADTRREVHGATIVAEVQIGDLHQSHQLAQANPAGE